MNQCTRHEASASRNMCRPTARKMPPSSMRLSGEAHHAGQILPCRRFQHAQNGMTKMTRRLARPCSG